MAIARYCRTVRTSPSSTPSLPDRVRTAPGSTSDCVRTGHAVASTHRGLLTPSCPRRHWFPVNPTDSSLSRRKGDRGVRDWTHTAAGQRYTIALGRTTSSGFLSSKLSRSPTHFSGGQTPFLSQSAAGHFMLPYTRRGQVARPNSIHHSKLLSPGAPPPVLLGLDAERA